MGQIRMKRVNQGVFTINGEHMVVDLLYNTPMDYYFVNGDRIKLEIADSNDYQFMFEYNG